MRSCGQKQTSNARCNELQSSHDVNRSRRDYLSLLKHTHCTDCSTPEEELTKLIKANRSIDLQTSSSDSRVYGSSRDERWREQLSKCRRRHRFVDTMEVSKPAQTSGKCCAISIRFWRFACNSIESRSKSWLERTGAQWRIKRQESARVYRACAMCRPKNSIAGKLVVTLEAKRWKSSVTAVIWHALCRFGSSQVEVTLT